jgi:hypothetical protein
MNLITPTLGGDDGEWDDKINACLELIDEHDHTPGKGLLITVAALDIDDDLVMGGLSLTGVGSVDFTAIAAPASGARRIFVSSVDNELYWRTNSGTNVKLTNGASINTTLVGGIVGDYAAVGAEVTYDDANKRYTFEQETDAWARLASGPVRIYEFNTTESVYVELAVAAALASSYTITLPDAVPAGTVPVQISASGIVSFSNVFVSPPGYTTEQTVSIHPCQYGLFDSTASWSMDSGGMWQIGTGTTDRLLIPVDLQSGDRIKAFSVKISKASDNTDTITATLFKRSISSSTSISVATNNENATGSTAVGNGSLTETYDSTKMYWIEIKHSDSSPSGTDTIGHAVVTIDRPA